MTSTIQRTETPREIIAELTALVDGEVTTRSRVIDGLLDLRNASDAEMFIDRIDEILADLPGLTTVPNPWWLECLAELSDLDG
jgi:hypothetical protein